VVIGLTVVVVGRHVVIGLPVVVVVGRHVGVGLIVVGLEVVTGFCVVVVVVVTSEI